MMELHPTTPTGYAELLRDLKQKIRSAQPRASLSVNQELVVLYWRIGREILVWQEREDWGAKVIDRLSADLKMAFPEMKGFSPRNLKYMRAFAEAWPDEALCSSLLHWLIVQAACCTKSLSPEPRCSGSTKSTPDYTGGKAGR